MMKYGSDEEAHQPQQNEGRFTLNQSNAVAHIAFYSVIRAL
jgi:hypothetical protein